MIIFGIMYWYKKAEILFRASSALKNIKEHARVAIIDRKRLKVALVVLDAVKRRYSDTKEFIDDTLKEECEKEKITADEVIFFQV